MISDKCYNLVAPQFGGWVLVNTARRHAEAGDREKALGATTNAAWTFIELGGEVMSESESKAIVTDLKVAKGYLEEQQLAAATEMLGRLSEQIFMASLQKVVECECRSRP